MKKHYRIAIGHIVLLLIFSIVLLKLPFATDEPVLHKLLRGFIVGTYVMLGKEILKFGVSCFKKRMLPAFNPSLLINGLILLSLACLVVAALFGWYISWEGSTGAYFGFAVLTASLLSDEGLAPTFDEVAST